MQHSDGGVVCEFVRQRCTHDSLFQPFYKRSNRTKGSKILRCFPHCCPNHAHRGFCGSSLHVRVEWPSASAGHRPPPPPPSIRVLGRFRLSDTPRLPVGHVLQAAAVLGAVQSDDTPNGEWIDSQMIYSWSETNWLFEINSAARWFYGWESSTVKSQRLKDHVLDVYVLAAATSPSGADVLRVVAATTSPAFQLISFRRATDDAMLALSATHHVRQQLQSGGGVAGGGGSGGGGGGGGRGGGDPHQHPLHQHHYLNEEKSIGPRPPHVHYHADVPSGMPSGGPPMRGAPLPSAPPHHPPHGRPLHHLHPPPSAHSSVPATRPLSLPSLRPPLASSTAPPAPSAVPQWTAPPLVSSIATSRPLTALAPLHRPPSSSLRAFDTRGPPPHHHPSQRAPPPPLASSAPPPTTRPLMVRSAAFAAPLQTPHHRAEARPQAMWRPPQLAIARPANAARTAMATMSISSSALSSAGSAPPLSAVGRDSAAWEVTNVLAQLHQIPLADAFERVAWVHETYVEYAAEYAKKEAEADVKDEEQLGKPEPRQSVDVDVRADAEMSVRRALASLGLHAASSPQRRKLPSRLLATLTELAIWLVFDPVAIQQLQGAVVSATETLADATLVRRFYSRAVFFLHDHIGRFLERRFQTTIGDVLRECESLGMQLQHEADAHASTTLPMSPGSAAMAAAGGGGGGGGAERAMKGQDAFVAQAREVLIATTSATRPMKRPRLALEAMKPRASDAALYLQHALSRHWTCSLNDVLVHRTSSSSSSGSSGSSSTADASLLTLLWFYRQFSAMTLALDAATQQLTVRSLFALASPLASQFVLDGRDRFVHAFPAGEATLATSVGRFAFGDYVGELQDATVRLQLYAFLSPTQLPSQELLPIERLAGGAACVYYDVALRVASDASLAVDVAVTTASLDIARLRRAGHADARALLHDMATWTLREKLAAVHDVEDASRVELVYRR